MLPTIILFSLIYREIDKIHADNETFFKVGFVVFVFVFACYVLYEIIKRSNEDRLFREYAFNTIKELNERNIQVLEKTSKERHDDYMVVTEIATNVRVESRSVLTEVKRLVSSMAEHMRIISSNNHNLGLEIRESNKALTDSVKHLTDEIRKREE